MISSVRLIALIRKEGFQILRDPSSLLICVVLPLLLLFLYGFGMSLDLDHLRIGLVLEDTAPDARNFAESLTDSRYFEVKIARDIRELTLDVTEGNLRGIVVVPSYFSSFRGRASTVAPNQVIADGSEPNTANFVQNYAKGAFQNWLKQESVSNDLQGLSSVQFETRFWYNEELESRYFLLPGSLAIIMTLIGILLTGLVIAREWERGTMEALLATPVTSLEIVLSKFIAYFVLGMISMILCVFLTVFFYGVPFRGSLFALLLVTAGFLFCALSIGLMISTLSKNQIVASQAAIVTGFLPAYMLSGFLFEISSMPWPIRFLTHLMPPRYFVQCLQTLFLVGNVWSLLLFNLLPLLLLGTIFFYITLRKTPLRLDA